MILSRIPLVWLFGGGKTPGGLFDPDAQGLQHPGLWIWQACAAHSRHQCHQSLSSSANVSATDSLEKVIDIVILVENIAFPNLTNL